MNSPSYTISIFDIMNTETAASSGTVSAKTGAALVTLGYAETGEINSVAEVWHPAGLLSIPALPNANNNNTDSAQAMAFVRGDQNMAFAFRDTRTELLAGNVAPGETVLYNSGNARVSLKTDDSITLSTKDGSGNAVYFQLSTTALTFMSPWGRIVFDATGFYVATANGCTFNMGGISLPGPLSSLSSTITMSSGIINLSSTSALMLGAGSVYGQVVVPISPYFPTVFGNPPGTPLPPFTTTTSPNVYVTITSP